MPSKIQQKIIDAFPNRKVEFVDIGNNCIGLMLDGKRVSGKWTRETEEALMKYHGLKMEDEVVDILIEALKNNATL